MKQANNKKTFKPIQNILDALDTLKTLSLVVPCYNEASRLNADAFIEFLKREPHIEIVFVNDGSSDKTLDVLKDLRAIRPSQISVLDLKNNLGKAEAVRLGLLHACNSGVANVAYWDADLATPLWEVENFLRIAKSNPNAQVIYGARMALLGHNVQRDATRVVVSKICNALARIALRMPINDTQCGAKMFRVSHSLRAALSEPFKTGWLFDIELMQRLTFEFDDNNAFYEYPLSEWKEIEGSSVSKSTVVKCGFAMLGLIFAPQTPQTLPISLANAAA